MGFLFKQWNESVVRPNLERCSLFLSDGFDLPSAAWASLRVTCGQHLNPFCSVFILSLLLYPILFHVQCQTVCFLLKVYLLPASLAAWSDSGGGWRGPGTGNLRWDVRDGGWLPDTVRFRGTAPSSQQEALQVGSGRK